MAENDDISRWDLPPTTRELNEFLWQFEGYDLDWMTKAMYREWKRMAEEWYYAHFPKFPLFTEHVQDMVHITNEYFEQGIRNKEFCAFTDKQASSFTFAHLTLKGKIWDTLE